MKRMKKIIAFALMMVMMMAMSITAFADNTTSSDTATLKIDISGISTRESSEIKVYKLATIDTENNKLVVETWAQNVYKEDYSADWVSELDKISSDVKQESLIKTVSSNGQSSITIDGLPGGIYYVTMSGFKVAYNSMVAKAYKVDDKGVYVADNTTVIAKGSSNNVEKDADDRFVKAGAVVTFTVKSTIPYFGDQTDRVYKLYDDAKNLTNPVEVSVDVDGTTIPNIDFNAGEEVTKDNVKYTRYTMDLSELVKDDSNAGKTVTVTYKSTVKGDDGYVNQAFDSTYDLDENGNPVNPPEKKGFTGKIIVTKVDGSNTAIKGKDDSASATFKVTHKDVKTNEVKTLKFVQVEDKLGVYKLAEEGDENTVDEVSTNYLDGTLTLSGLEEGDYDFEETKAPNGFAKRNGVVTITISDKDANGNEVTQNVTVEGEDGYIVNTTLSSLPFTGGMGTTIFTVLGVAIMVLAAALYFVSKRKAAK